MENTGRIVWAIAREEVRLARGLRAFTAIALGAPMAGVLATCFQFVEPYGGYVGSPDTKLEAFARHFAEAIIPTAAGLAISIFAMSAERYLRRQVESLVHEMLWFQAQRRALE